MANFDNKVPVQTIIAGKFRRYNHVSFARQLLWGSVVILNIRDGFLVILGLIQSFFKLILWRPDVIFAKGGYVCLPVGVAAKLLGIPLVIHDSDAHPGLTNRILGKWAKAIATGAPLKHYSYPASKSRYVGIPISDDFHKFDEVEKKNARKLWGIDQKSPLIVITGGGLGAQRINDAVLKTIEDLMNLGTVVLVSGVGQYDELRSLVPPNGSNFQLHSFIAKDMAKLLGAADVVVTRAGATSTLELAALAKPTILIPNKKLTGGHQLKNAMVYFEKGAVLVIEEDNLLTKPGVLVEEIRKVLQDRKLAQKMSDEFAKFKKPDAAKDVADMILSCGK